MPKRIKKNGQHIKEHFKSVDPVLFKAMRDIELAPFETEKDPAKYFYRLCRSIIGQQLAGSAARVIMKRFETLFEGKPITPARVLNIPEKDLRAIGMSWAKARYIRELARSVETKEIQLKNLADWDDERVIEELVKVKGIGKWTAEMFLIFTLGRENVFSFGDLGLQNGFKRLYGTRRAASKKSMERITNRWSPYRSYGSLTLWHVKDTKK